MAAAVAALVTGLTVAFATSFNTDSWGCGWSGASVGTNGGYSYTAANSCAVAARVQVSYYWMGSWYDNSDVYDYGSPPYAQDTAPMGSIHAVHQIGVAYYGWGQVEVTTT